MKAMILAAGRGERMRPLTDTVPKPLLPVAGRPLIAWHLIKLAQAGLREVIINHAWLGHKLVEALGDGRQFGLRLSYSAENPALETAGGIAQALAFFENQPFLVINGDVWSDWDPALAGEYAQAMVQERALAGLIMVNNPEHHPQGDFQPLARTGAHFRLAARPAPGIDKTATLTFSGIGIYQPALFAGLAAGQPHALAPLLVDAMTDGKVIGWHHRGEWLDVGTPKRLARLEQRLAMAPHAGYTLDCSDRNSEKK